VIHESAVHRHAFELAILTLIESAHSDVPDALPLRGALCDGLLDAGTFQRLDPVKWPGCFYARSSPNDVARVEDRTYICSRSKDGAGPTNNWEDPFVMRRKLKTLFKGCVRGRTMHVMPFSMGPVGSPMSQIGVQLTVSAYAVVNMRIMARIGLPVYAVIDKDYKRVVPCVSFGRRATAARAGRRAVAAERYQVHRPLPGDARNLELRLGLRRQRPAGQEVLRAAHRQQHRAR
jgi:GTP-dependent phosphoenolpyruvate carboxykinase